MKILEKLRAKQENLYGAPSVTIAFLGDSVTQGCFEVYRTGLDSIETVFEPNNSYSAKLRQMLAVLYPNVQINIINSGISGDKAPNGAARIERDILRYSPDLVIVSYGLNDSTLGLENVERYSNALNTIFRRLAEAEIETIFLTENMMNTNISCFIQDEGLRKTAEMLANVENGGVLARYFDEAKKVAAAHGVRVCDCYAKWRHMHEVGVNTTELLANYLNHPSREMVTLFSISLLETMFA